MELKLNLILEEIPRFGIGARCKAPTTTCTNGTLGGGNAADGPNAESREPFAEAVLSSNPKAQQQTGNVQVGEDW